MRVKISLQSCGHCSILEVMWLKFRCLEASTFTTASYKFNSPIHLFPLDSALLACILPSLISAILSLISVDLYCLDADSKAVLLQEGCTRPMKGNSLSHSQMCLISRGKKRVKVSWRSVVEFRVTKWAEIEEIAGFGELKWRQTWQGRTSIRSWPNELGLLELLPLNSTVTWYFT